MTEYLLSLAALPAGLILALGIIPCGFWIVKVLRSDEGYLPWMFFFSTLVNTLLILNSDRNLFVNPEEATGGEEIVMNVPVPGWISWIARINMALFAYSATKRIIYGVLEAKHYPTSTPHYLIISFLLFIFTTMLLPALFGAVPSFEHGYLYLLIAGLASLFFKDGEEKLCIRSVRNTYYLFLLFGACFVPFRPHFVMYNDYTSGLIPGLIYRYAGLAAHPNHLGIYLVLFMLCLKSEPFKNKFLNFSAWILAILSLFFSQSKTCWITTLLSILILSYYQYSDIIKHHVFNFQKPIIPATLIVISMLCMLGILALVMFGSLGTKVDAFMNSQAGSDMMSLTGRDIIWKAALNEWHRNPVFGYGLTIWDENYRAKLGYSFATSAHNQILETMSSAGTVGLIGFLIYSFTLFWHVLKTARSSQGMSLAIFFSLYLRTTSEASIPVIKHFGPDGMTHILLLMIIGAQYKFTDVKKQLATVKNALAKINYSKG